MTTRQVAVALAALLAAGCYKTHRWERVGHPAFERRSEEQARAVMEELSAVVEKDLLTVEAREQGFCRTAAVGDLQIKERAGQSKTGGGIAATSLGLGAPLLAVGTVGLIIGSTTEEGEEPFISEDASIGLAATGGAMALAGLIHMLLPKTTTTERTKSVPHRQWAGPTRPCGAPQPITDGLVRLTAHVGPRTLTYARKLEGRSSARFPLAELRQVAAACGKKVRVDITLATPHPTTPRDDFERGSPGARQVRWAAKTRRVRVAPSTTDETAALSPAARDAASACRDARLRKQARQEAARKAAAEQARRAAAARAQEAARLARERKQREAARRRDVERKRKQCIKNFIPQYREECDERRACMEERAQALCATAHPH